MKPKRNLDSNVVIGVAIIAAIFVIGLIYTQLTQRNSAYNYQVATPEEVVRQYFESWSKKDWPNMYAAISDGFKRIDPNAKSLATFKDFASLQDIGGINILSIKEISNDGTTASVSYSVEFVLSDGSKRPFSDRFTLKFRQGDIIPGWKLIHPYGANIDTT